jgi:hypothetical protein
VFYSVVAQAQSAQPLLVLLVKLYFQTVQAMHHRSEISTAAHTNKLLGREFPSPHFGDT